MRLSTSLPPKGDHGFTLIELLVVIGILGILATTLFFSMNITEQLSRGNDVSKKQAAESFFGATTTYYISQNAYPWQNATCGTLDATPLYAGGSVNSCVTELINKDELPSTYDDDTDVLSEIYLTDLTGSGGRFAVCFKPESRADQDALQTKYNANGSESTTCGSTGDCHMCLVY